MVETWQTFGIYVDICDPAGSFVIFDIYSAKYKSTIK